MSRRRQIGPRAGTWALGDLLAGGGPMAWNQVYVVRDSEGAVLYVGTTVVGVGRRLRQHISARSPLGIAMGEIEGAPGWTVEVLAPLDRLATERALIAEHLPPLNSAGVLPARREVSRLPRSRAWLELAAREPRLSALRIRLETLVRQRGRRELCWDAVWYGDGGIKERLSMLVGWEVEGRDGVLGSEDTYDLVYDTLLRLLPECRHLGACSG